MSFSRDITGQLYVASLSGCARLSDATGLAIASILRTEHDALLKTGNTQDRIEARAIRASVNVLEDLGEVSLGAAA